MRLRLVPASIALVALVGAVLQTQLSASAEYATPVHQQWVTVSAPSSTSTYATVEAWEWQSTNGLYKRVAVFTSARIGAQGMGTTQEGVARTPTGRYPLTQPFGVAPKPSGVTTSYFQVDANDIWSDSTYPAYGNRHARCAPGTCPYYYGDFEQLSKYPSQYKYAVFIGYNAPAPYGSGVVAGKGSAFFLHVKNAYATGGCVAVSESQMLWLLRWFKSTKSPAIALGVGSNAYNPIPNRYV